jgi:hypothetical protein
VYEYEFAFSNSFYVLQIFKKCMNFEFYLLVHHFLQNRGFQVSLRKLIFFFLKIPGVPGVPGYPLPPPVPP